MSKEKSESFEVTDHDGKKYPARVLKRFESEVFIAEGERNQAGNQPTVRKLQPVALVEFSYPAEKAGDSARLVTADVIVGPPKPGKRTLQVVG